MGSRRAAWRAGQTPKTTPTARLKRTADDDGRRVEGEAPAGELADDGGDDEPDDDADQAAEEREGQGLDEELGEDVAAARADGLADADLARPLADRDQHDVHDPDAADDERDRGDARRAAASGSPLIDDAASSSWVWSKTLKSSSSRRGQLVAVAQERGDARSWSTSIWSASATLTRRSCGRCRRRRSTSARPRPGP